MLSLERLAELRITAPATDYSAIEYDSETGQQSVASQESSSTTLSWNPRLALDYNVFLGLTLGVHGAYRFDVHKREWEVADASGDVDGSDRLTTHRLEVGGRLGYAWSTSHWGLWPRVAVSHQREWGTYKANGDPVRTTLGHTRSSFELAGLARLGRGVTLSFSPFIELAHSDQANAWGAWTGLGFAL